MHLLQPFSWTAQRSTHHQQHLERGHCRVHRSPWTAQHGLLRQEPISLLHINLMSQLIFDNMVLQPRGPGHLFWVSCSTPLKRRILNIRTSGGCIEHGYKWQTHIDSSRVCVHTHTMSTVSRLYTMSVTVLSVFASVCPYWDFCHGSISAASCRLSQDLGPDAMNFLTEATDSIIDKTSAP